MPLLLRFALPTKKKLLVAALIIAVHFTGYYLGHMMDGAEPPHQSPPYYALYVLTWPVLLLARAVLDPLRVMNQRYHWPDELCALILFAFHYLFACAATEAFDWARRKREK